MGAAMAGSEDGVQSPAVAAAARAAESAAASTRASLSALSESGRPGGGDDSAWQELWRRAGEAECTAAAALPRCHPALGSLREAAAAAAAEAGEAAEAARLLWRVAAGASQRLPA